MNGWAASRPVRPSRRLGLVFPLLLLLLAGCVRFTPPVAEPTPTPSPEPTPTPTPAPSPTPTLAHEGEWLVTFVPDEGEAFTHALQVTADVSLAELSNAGGGLQELCAESCGGTEADGFGFIGDLLLPDGTTMLALALFTQTAAVGSTALKAYTLEPIMVATSETGQQTFTTAAAWAVSDLERVQGTLTATRVGEARALSGFGLINMGQAVEMARDAIYQGPMSN